MRLLKAFTIAAMLMAGNLMGSAQTLLFSEGFETLPYALNASGPAIWSASSMLKASGNFSDSARLINAGDSAVLTSQAFATTGMTDVALKFKHICKVDFFDAAYLEFSTDNGTTWTRMDGNHYRGSGQFISFNAQFKDGSYIDWAPLNNNVVPTNSWWKEEVFDLSGVAAGFAQVRVRFTLKDMNANGGSGAYGWLIDDVQVTGGLHNLVPPQIFPSTGNPAGQVAGTGPFVVEATILDSTGVLSAKMVYTSGSTTDTIMMVKTTGSLYRAEIPSLPYLSSACYRILASDSSLYQNMTVFPAVGCIQFSNYKAPVTVQVGTSTLSGYNAPIYNSTASSTDKYSQHISLFTPTEIGIKGNIQSLIWEKANTIGYVPADAKLRIFLKHSNLTIVSTAAGTFATELAGATLVFEDTLLSLPATAGWQSFIFNKTNFNYNGTQNLMVMVDWYRPGSLSGNYINWSYSNAPNQAVTFYGTSSNPGNTIGAGQRPNTRFVIDQMYVNHDASVQAISSPTTTFISSLPVPVIVNLKNGGTLPLTKATINWSVNGSIQTPYLWTGNLLTDMIASNVTLGSYQFGLGSNTIKVWSSMPNDSADMLPTNDTMQISAFGCNQILNGTYTVGNASADFQSFSDLFMALKNCGISGPCTFRIMPGTYTDRLQISDTIPGLSSTNTITFTSFNNDASSVIIKPATAGSANNYVINLNGAKYITIDRVTLVTESTAAGNCITFTNNARYNTISNNVLQMVYGENNGVVGITLSGGCNYNTLIGNRITNGYKSISATGTSANKIVGISIINNTLTDGSRYGADISYNDSALFEGNNVYCSFSAPSSSRYGLYLNYSTFNRILRNKIHMHVTGYAYTIYYSYCNDVSARPSLIANNFLLNTGTSTVYGNHALNYQYSSNTRIIHNSMMVATGNSNAGTINFEGSSNNLTMLNNVVTNMAGGLAINHYSSAGALLSTSNYNNFYSSGSTLAKWNSSTLVPVTGGITALTAVTTKDSNSIVANPLFYSLTDLHSFSPMMNNAGIPVSDVTSDYDGQPRSLSNPDIGADEYNVASVDAGIAAITSPGGTLVQGNNVPVKAIIRNYGSNPLTSCQVSYTLNGGTPVTTTWTGNLATGATDTVTFPALTIPAMSFTMKVYTLLAGDTLSFNDTTLQTFFGAPLVDALVQAVTAPAGGCNPGSETVTITIKNDGQQSITTGLTASYQLVGSSNIVTEPVNQTLAPAGTLSFSFATPVNLSTAVDSVFSLNVWVNHPTDPNAGNDTTISLIPALALLPAPVVSGQTISYGQTATLIATSANPVEWYNAPTAGTKLASGLQYITPPLFDTTTYYVWANTNIPSGSFIIGQGTNESGQYEFPNPFGKAMGGNKTQYLILASEMAAQGYSAGPISSVSFYSNAAIGTVTNIEIALGTTSLAQATTTFFTSPLTTIFSGTVNITAGWVTIQLPTPYPWDGTSNIIVQSLAGSGVTLLNPPLVYDSTLLPMTVYYAGINAPTATTGTTTLKRHNIRINTIGTAGCNSVRVPVTVVVPPLQRDVMVKAFSQPVSGCGIGTTPVTIQVMNHGYDTLLGGIQVRYRINSGAFTTPETISATILPYSSYNHTFAATASLPSGPVKQSHILTAVATMTGDMYIPNDTLKSDTIISVYTPAPVAANPLTIPYATPATLSPVATDTLYWYQQPAGGTPFFTGSPYTTPALYDTTVYWVESRFTSPVNTYQVGIGTSYNGATTYPTPYGSTQYGTKHQFLIRASELTALGMQKGEIRSIGFNIAGAGTPVLNNYSISLGHTQQSTMGQFETNLTTVFASPALTIANGINTHTLQIPFTWDGVNNLVVETCFKNGANGSNSQVYLTNTGFSATLMAVGQAAFDCSVSSGTASYTTRPNMYLKMVSYGDCISARVPQQVNVSGIPAVDASITQIITPQGTASSTSPTTVSVELKNYGTTALTSAPIWYQVNNNTPQVYNWTGNLVRLAATTVNVGSITLSGGLETLKVWVSKTGDAYPVNDTANMNLNVCMSGTYTIGQGKRFTTITQAVTALTTSGVCGHTIFDIDPGIYGERLIIPAISGAGPNATILFRSSTLDSTDVTVQELTDANNTYVINLNNASWVSLKHLTINANGTAYGYAVSLQNSCTNISISNNVLNGATSNTMGNAAAVYSGSPALQYITIANNRVSNGYSGIHFTGVNGTGNQKKVLITGNFVTNYYQVGIYAFYQDSLEISHNRIISGTINQYYYGIRSYYLANTYKIHSNNITLSATSYGTGIDINYATGSASAYGLVYNNMIVCNQGTGNHVGLSSASNTFVRFAFNSVWVSGASTAKRAVYVTSGSNNEFVNNNLACEDHGYAFYTTIPGTITVMDRNNYYPGNPSGTFVYWGGPINSLAAFIAYDPSKNANSISTDPVYKGYDNLHTDNILLNAKASPIAGITTDMDGQTRNATTPDIGADEFFPAPFDLAIHKFIKPYESSCYYTGSDSIIVGLRNSGENTWNFATNPAVIKVYITGYITDSLMITINNGTLISGVTMPVTVHPSYNLSANGKYMMYAIVNAALDTISANNQGPQLTFVSLPAISTFPRIEDFESGDNLTFNEYNGIDAKISVSGNAAMNSLNGLHFEGGGYSNWTNPATVTAAFNNATHVTTASTCMITPGTAANLKLKLDLKQTYYAVAAPNTSWFRVMLHNANGSFYLTNAAGDSVFQAITPNTDPFVTHVFDLQGYLSIPFQISLEAVCRLRYGEGNYSGDNVYVDNIRLWEPAQNDAALQGVITPALNYNKAGNLQYVEVAVTNLGTQNITSLPLKYQYSGFPAVSETFTTSILPYFTQTFTFTVPFQVTPGLHTLCMTTMLPNDQDASNDSICISFRGINTFMVPFSDDFEGSQEWADQGTYQQWEKGLPSNTLINAAHSGTNAWVTKLDQDYTPSSVEILYSPYFIIPQVTDTATVGFWQWMDAVADQAYGVLQYTTNLGNSWNNLGYIGTTDGTNWYNSNINGTHCWSTTHFGWTQSSHILYPSVFNTGMPFQFRFIFYAKNYQLTAEGWGIDDFSITIPPPQHDASTLSILTPASSTPMGDQIQVSAKIVNKGVQTITSLPLNYKAGNQPTVTEIWNGSLATGDTLTYNFLATYTAPVTNYNLCIWTTLAGDAYTFNDSVCMQVTATAGKQDAGVTGITAPAGQITIGNTIEVKVILQNFGTDTLTSIPVEYRVNNLLMGSETYTGTLLPGATVNYTFTTTYITPAGQTQICANTQLSGDANPTNNEHCVQVVATGINDHDRGGFVVGQNIPNPAGSYTTIPIYTSQGGQATVRITDLAGKLTAVHRYNVTEGHNELSLITSGMAEGLYFYSVEFNGQTITRKMAVTR